MRSVKQPQSALRYPLNAILGTEGNVRVLRVVLSSDTPIGVSELARQTRLQRAGVAKLCIRLEDLGVIEAVGRGSRNRQYRRHRRSQLASEIARLFQEERSRFDRLLDNVRQVVQSRSGVRSAWIQGPVARETDSPEDPLIIGALVDPATMLDVRQRLGEALVGVQAIHDVTIELRPMTMADLHALEEPALAELHDARPLSGPLPLDLLAAEREESPPGRGTRPGKTHATADARAKRLATLVAERLRADPSLAEEARRWVDRRLPAASPGERLELLEWKHILDTMSIPRLRRFLGSDTAHATRLRQSLPFLHALSAEDRHALFTEADGESRDPG